VPAVGVDVVPVEREPCRPVDHDVDLLMAAPIARLVVRLDDGLTRPCGAVGRDADRAHAHERADRMPGESRGEPDGVELADRGDFVSGLLGYPALLGSS
jgi:hypothetical protein